MGFGVDSFPCGCVLDLQLLLAELGGQTGLAGVRLVEQRPIIGQRRIKRKEVGPPAREAAAHGQLGVAEREIVRILL